MKKRLFALLLCMMMVIGTLTGCGEEAPEEPKGPTSSTYTVTVVSVAGKVFEKANVEIKCDGETVATGETDSEGTIAFELEDGKEYKVVVSNLASVYTLEEEYAFTEKEAKVVPGSIFPTALPHGTKLREGDTIFEFTVNAAGGKKVSLTDLIAENELTVLNFWYQNCGYCTQELPYLIEAYEMLKDDLEILALNPIDSSDDVRKYKDQRNVPYLLAQCSGKVADTFGIAGYPTTIIIDQEGTIVSFHVGALLTTEEFVEMFKEHLGDE